MDQARYISMNPDGNPYCNICKKVATESHIASGPHLKAMEEVAISDAMGGATSDGFRRFGDHCTGMATKRLIMDFWGQNIMWLPLYGRRVQTEKKAFYINSDLKKPLTVEQSTMELGIVSYTGTGKYQHSSYIAFHDLPDQEDTATPDEKQRTSPEGQGWWPVLSLGEEFCKTHGRYVLLVCFYQLQLKEAIVPVWKIYPDWTDPVPAPKAKARPQSGAPKAKAMPQSGAASSSTSPGGVWAEDDEMDAPASASASASASNLVLRLRGITAVPTAAPPPPPPPRARSWAEEEDDPNVEMDDVSDD